MKIENYKIDFEVAGHGSVSTTPITITHESNSIQSAGDIYQFEMNSNPWAGVTATIYPVSDKIELGPQIRAGYAKRDGIVAYDPISVDTTGGCTTNAMGVTDSADCVLGTGYHIFGYNDEFLDVSVFLEGRGNNLVGPLDAVFRVGVQTMIPQENTRSVDVSGVAEIGVAI